MARRVALFALLLLAAPGAAQPVNATRLRGEAEAVRTRKRLTEAQQKLDGKPAEAADDLQKILDESGDDLVLVRDNNFQPARRLAHQYLASLPAAQLTTFRNRLDEPAKKLLDAGRKARDPQPLRELLDRYFVSRPAEDALLLLGELAFERGDFADAERQWRKLLPEDTPDELKYPTPKTPAEVVRAKLILARVFAGDVTRAKADLDQFRKDHPTAAGPLAGTTGGYADTLAKLLAAPPRLPADAAGWSTFAGNAARDGRPSGPLPRYWPSRPTWHTPIPREAADTKREQKKPGSSAFAKGLVFHPVVLNGYAYLADAGRVFRFDLKTGAARLAFHYETLRDPPEFFRERGERDTHDAAALAVPCPLDVDFTLTAANGKLFARLGPVAPPDGSDQDAKLRTYLVALEPKADPNPPAGELPLAVTWQAAPPAVAGVAAVWEGAPVAADGRLFASFVRLENSRYVSAVACYPEGGARKPLWVADVCDTDANRAAGAKPRDEVLSVAGPTVVYASHTGVTVAVSASTGKPAWAFRNPPAARPPVSSPRGLCPPVCSGGRVFLAPADGDAVYALDAETGRPLWSAAPGFQVDHLLGAIGGRLVATVHGLPQAPQLGLPHHANKSVRGFDVATGSDQFKGGGWIQNDDPGLGSLGRGLAADSLILWPTKGIPGTLDRDKLSPGRLWLLDPATGRQARPGVAGVPGNFAYADGVALVATPTELCGYVFDRSNEKLLPVPPPQPVITVTGKPTPFRADEIVPRAKAEFDPVDAPSLAAPARVAREAKLPPAAWPLRPFGRPCDTHTALCDGKRLFAVELATGKTAWQATLDPPAALTHVAVAADGTVYAVGPHAALAVRADGRPKWEYRLPESDDAAAGLSPAGFAGNRLVLRLGVRTLLALDTDAGKVAWVRDALGRTEYRGPSIDTAPRFGDHFVITPTAVIAHRSDGVRLAFDPAAAAPLGEGKSSLVAWSGPPAVFSETGRGVVIPIGPTSLEAGEATGAFGRWRFDAGREASATGVPPQAHTFGNACLVAVSRNIGSELHLLSAKDGGARWRRPPFLPVSDPDLGAADADRERIYLPTPTKLFALNREDGHTAWTADLPPLPDGTAWKVRAGRRAVIAHPTAPVAEEDTGVVVGRIARRFLAAPDVRKLPVALLGAFDAWASRTLPVLLFDPDSGHLDQRLDVPTTGPVVQVSLHADAAVVTSVGQTVWLGK